MWISKKKYKAILTRVVELKKQVKYQQLTLDLIEKDTLSMNELSEIYKSLKDSSSFKGSI